MPISDSFNQMGPALRRDKGANNKKGTFHFIFIQNGDDFLIGIFGVGHVIECQGYMLTCPIPC
jgi:hypothetical protein